MPCSWRQLGLQSPLARGHAHLNTPFHALIKNPQIQRGGDHRVKHCFPPVLHRGAPAGPIPHWPHAPGLSPQLTSTRCVMSLHSGVVCPYALPRRWYQLDECCVYMNAVTLCVCVSIPNCTLSCWSSQVVPARPVLPLLPRPRAPGDAAPRAVAVRARDHGPHPGGHPGAVRAAALHLHPVQVGPSARRTRAQELVLVACKPKGKGDDLVGKLLCMLLAKGVTREMRWGRQWDLRLACP